MMRESDHLVNLAALEKKLDAIRRAFHALSPSELQALVADPNLLRRVFSAERKTNLPELDRTVRDLLENADRLVATFAPVVQVTKAQRIEARDLQIEIWKKQGIAEEMLALARIRSVRVDPFADQDPEPTSEEEE
jgi:hypothetical protein